MRENEEIGSKLHQNKLPLEGILTADVKHEAGEKGSSASYTPTVDGQQYYVKTPNYHTYSPETYTGKFPQLKPFQRDDDGEIIPESPKNIRILQKAQMTPETKRGDFDPNLLHNQEFVVRKALFVNALSNSLGVETGELQHWYGKPQGEKHPQNFLASKIEHPDRTISDVTDSKIKGFEDVLTRPPMTTYGDDAIVDATVNKKKMTGFGEYIAIAPLLGPPDGHGSNFLLVEKPQTVELISLDGAKASCGSGLGKSYFGFDHKQEISDLEGTIKSLENPKSLYDKREELASPGNEKAFNKAFNEEKQTVIKLFDGGKAEQAEQYLDRSLTLFPLAVMAVDKDMMVLLKATQAQDFHPLLASDDTPINEMRATRMDGDKAQTQDIERMTNICTALKGEGSIENRLKYSLPSQEDYPATLGTSLNVFKFPFPDDFHQAEHVKNGYLDTSYKDMHLDMGVVKNMAHKHFGPEHEKNADKIMTEMEARQQHLSQTLGKNPEYLQYVETNKERLEQSMPAVYATLETQLAGSGQTAAVDAIDMGHKREKSLPSCVKEASEKQPTIMDNVKEMKENSITNTSHKSPASNLTFAPGKPATGPERHQ